MKILIPVLILCPFLALADSAEPFATQVVAATGLGTNPFTNDPAAILGKPTVENVDSVNGGPSGLIASSLVYAPWRTCSTGQNAVCTIPAGASVIVGFTTPIQNLAANPEGKDFIVFGNSFFLNSLGTIAWNSDMDAVRIGAGPFAEPVTVSVSPDLLRWYTYSQPTADGLWPTQARSWNPFTHAWGRERDFQTPVPASLSASAVQNRTVAEAILSYGASGGGTAFDLAPSGFSQIRYIRFESNGGEVDAVARVRLGRTEVPTRGTASPPVRL